MKKILQTNIFKKSFYFIRHGQTNFNLNGIYNNIDDQNLNNNGILQAQKSSEIIKNLDIDIIFSSPLKRAKETSEIINSKLNKQINYINELSEDSIYLKFLENHDKFFSIQDFFVNQLYITLNNCLKKSEKSLIVSHAGVYYIIRKILLLEDYNIKNCEILYHFYKDNKWYSKVIY